MLRLKITPMSVAMPALAALLLLFQNCTSPHFQSNKFSLTGGTGADGLTFRSYGLCPDNQTGIASIILVSSDLQSASLIEQNCQELNSPQSLEMSEIQFSISDPTVLQFNGQVFDQQIGGGQKVTLQFCETSTVQSLVWEQIGNTSQLYGSVTQNSGSASGSLNVLPPPQGSLEYITQSGQTSQFDLNLNVNPATLSYTIGGGTAVSVPSLVCASQTPPTPQADGSSQAPSGPAQESAILASYALRAPWKVAGVDYAVGYPSGTTLKNPLTDPAITSNPNITIDTQNQILHIAGDNITLSGYDFGNYTVSVDSGTNTTITNSNVVMITTAAASSNLTVTNCVMDGGGSGGKWALIANSGTGTVTVQYNWMKNFPSKAIQNTATSESLIFKYNLLEYGGSNSSGDDIYFGSGNYSSVVIEFNTIYQPVVGDTDEAISMHDPNMIASGDIAYNTLMAIPGSGGMTMSYMVHVSSGGTQVPVTFQIHDNYMDPRGAYGPFFPTPNGNGTALTLSNNFNMSSGQGLPTTL